MRSKNLKLIFSFIVLAIVPRVEAQRDLPRDFSPYVRLGYHVKVSVFKNPVIDQSTQQIIDTGQLVKEEIVQMQVGSGTIISRDGLILTNNHVYQMQDNIQYDKKSQVLYLAQPASKAMLVYTLKENDPLQVPVLQYLADPVSLDEEHDTALLKINRDKDGNELIKEDFSFVELGNPFGMELNENLTIFGYPSKGGDTITVTEGKFLGYYRDARYPGLDGFIKTNAAMAPGNSGGSALNKNKLIGVPTAVTLPTQAGSDLGYIHPITWAAEVLTVAKEKFDLRTPQIPARWFASTHNTDDTKDHLFVTGRIVSSHSQEPVMANVIIAREDRSLKQIENLHRELQIVSMVYIIQRMHDAGLSIDEIALRFQAPQEEIQNILSTELDEESLHPDILSSLEGNFFYRFTQSDDQGFFILSVPKENKVKLHIILQGYHSIEKSISLSSALSLNLGKIVLFRQR